MHNVRKILFNICCLIFNVIYKYLKNNVYPESVNVLISFKVSYVNTRNLELFALFLVCIVRLYYLPYLIL
jgi:hypothetical protein